MTPRPPRFTLFCSRPFFFFFFNDTATTEIYTLSLHDALPIYTQYFLRIRRVALGGGALQIGLTLLAALVAMPLLGWPLRPALVIGCILALSSTEIGRAHV